jgi:hypothetical protein
MQYGQEIFSTTVYPYLMHAAMYCFILYSNQPMHN